MKSIESKIKYNVWLNAETMHKNSRNWISELEFIKDEQLFFEDLIKSYTLQMIDSSHFSESKKVVDDLNKLKKENSKLIGMVKNHEKDLKIMVDGINEIVKEKAYKNKHTKLKLVIENYLDKYRSLKTQLFRLIKDIIKEGKQKRLLL